MSWEKFWTKHMGGVVHEIDFLPVIKSLSLSSGPSRRKYWDIKSNFLEKHL